jgi:hypothetical protein
LTFVDEEIRLLRQIIFSGALATSDDIIGFGEPEIDLHLERLRAAGWIEPPPLIVATATGEDRLEAWYDQLRGNLDPAQRDEIIDRFRPLDIEIKRLASAWQEAVQRDDWDGRVSVVEGLADLHERTDAFVAEHAARLPALPHFASRLGAALDRVLDGDADHVVGVRCDSYHTVWFQMHEDLLRTLQRQRDAE